MPQNKLDDHPISETEIISATKKLKTKLKKHVAYVVFITSVAPHNINSFLDYPKVWIFPGQLVKRTNYCNL